MTNGLPLTASWSYGRPITNHTGGTVTFVVHPNSRLGDVIDARSDKRRRMASVHRPPPVRVQDASLEMARLDPKDRPRLPAWLVCTLGAQRQRRAVRSRPGAKR